VATTPFALSVGMSMLNHCMTTKAPLDASASVTTPPESPDGVVAYGTPALASDAALQAVA